MNFGLLTLLPAVAVLVIAIATKKTTESLFIGGILSYLIIAIFNGGNFITMITDSFFKVVTDYDNQWMIILTGLFGSLIALLSASNATYAIAKFLGKFCKTERSTLIATWILGVVIFIDDTLNIMAVGTCMKSLADKNKVPRESLAYVVDSTTAPACVVFPFSTWVIFYAGVFWEQDAVKSLGYASAMQTYYHIIPFVFYGMIALILVPLFAFGILPKFGAMKKVYQRITSTDSVFSKASEKLNEVMNTSDNIEVEHSSLWDFIVPIVVLIALTFIIDDMLIAVIASIFVCLIMFTIERRITLNEFCKLWIKGFADMIPALAILIAALFMRNACADIMLPDYIINAVGPFISAKLFPLMTFIIVAGLAFVTGSCWGVPGVCTPILIPLAVACNANLILVMAAIVSGGTFGSHACFYSDATVITSSICGIDNMDHAKTQFPYALIGAGITCLAYLIVGFVM